MKKLNKHRIAGFIATLALVPSLWLAHCGWSKNLPKSGEPWDWTKIAQVIVAIAWTVLPPIWFWYEYFFIYRKGHADGTQPPDFDMFKYGQDVSAKIWLAVVAALFVLYFHKDIH